jgi:Transposase IS66 family
MPLVETIRAHVFAAERIHADDTTVPVLAKGKTRTGRLWTYVRDDQPFGGPDPPAAAFFYSPDRGGEHPEQHLASYAGHGPSRHPAATQHFSRFRGIADMKRFSAPDDLSRKTRNRHGSDLSIRAKLQNQRDTRRLSLGGFMPLAETSGSLLRPCPPSTPTDTGPSIVTRRMVRGSSP